MHGSILPKNPAVADYLIEKAVMRKFGIYHPQVIDDHIAETARETAVTRPR